MLQRSPSYVVLVARRRTRSPRLLRPRSPAAARVSDRAMEERAADMLSFQLSRRRPRAMKALIRRGLERAAPARLRHRHPLQARATTRGTSACAWCPTATCSRRSAQGRASVVTDQIETFTETGIRLASGDELDADVIVTATGLNLLALGGIALTVDGRRGRLAQNDGLQGHDAQRRARTSRFAIGYTNASWTLKCDLTCEYVCRLLRPHGRARLPLVHAAQQRPNRRSRSRSSTSRPATSSARSTRSRGRDRRRRGGCTRTTLSTSSA